MVLPPLGSTMTTAATIEIATTPTTAVITAAKANTRAQDAS